MKKRIIALTALLMLLVSLMPAAMASFDVSTRESVVVVTTYLELENIGEKGWDMGTGFFVGRKGEDPSNLITNHHVIKNYQTLGSGELCGYSVALDADGNEVWTCYENYRDERAQAIGRSKIRVYYDSNTFTEAYLVETSEAMDVAILRLDNPTSQRKPIALCSPTDAMVGSTVYAVGYPGLSDTVFSSSTSKWGLSDVTVTSGSVSRLLTTSGTGQRNIQIDCDIKPGNSGGPLVNADGAAIGINTWSVSNSSGQSVNYAVNIDEAITLLNRNGVVYDMAGTASQPAVPEEPDKSNEPDKSEAPPVQNTQPDVSTQPNTTPEPAPAPAGSNTPLIIGGVAVAAVVIAAVVLMSRKKNVPPAQPISPTSPAVPAMGQSGGLRLQGVSGNFAGRRFPIDKQVRIGRDPARNDLVYPANAPGVSGAHCVLKAEGGQERFLQEARTMAKMEKLSTIVSVRDFFEINNTAYIVMEYVDGTTFKELVEQRGGRISAGELLHTIEPLFSALSSMHNLGLIHRDISPENLMLEKGEVRLLDFGCARETAGGEATLTIALKHGYAPVEQYQSKGQGPWTDVYALSATLYYCLTGRKPPQAMDRLVEDELIPPRQLGADLTERQEQALLRGMAVTPRRRFQSVQELHTALYEGVMPPAPPETPPPRTVAAPAAESDAAPEPVPPSEPDREPESTPETIPAVRDKWSPKQMGVFAGCAAALLCVILLFAWHPWVRPDGPGNVSQGAQPPVSAFRDAAVLTGGDESGLRALLEDADVNAVTLSGCDIIVYQPLDVGKPLRVEPGSRLDTAQYVTVRGGGALRVEGELYVNGLLRTEGGGSVSVAPQGTLDGVNLLWTEREEDLSVETGGTVLLHSGQPMDDAHRLTLPEEDMFSHAVHVNSARQLLAALDENSQPVVIDSDITIETGEGFGQSCAVLVPEGVTVTMTGETGWCVNGAKLVNRGTIQGGLVQTGQWDAQNVSWIVNYGLIDAGGYFDDAGGLINLGEIRLHQCQIKSGMGVCNLGTLASCGVKSSPVPIHHQPENEFYLDIACESLFNYGTLLVEGDGPGEKERGCMNFANGLRVYNAGEILAGAYGWLANGTHLENNGGALRVTADTGTLDNSGTMEFLGTPGSLAVPSSCEDSWNNGLILACREDVDALPDRMVQNDGGRVVSFTWDTLENARTVSNGPQLREAMADESCGVVLVEKRAEIVLESELTVTKTLALSGGGRLVLSSGDLTVSGPEAFLLGNVDLRGGALRVEDGGAAMVRELSNCGGVCLSGERSLLSLDSPPDPGAPVEVTGGTLLSTRSLELNGSQVRIDSMAIFSGGLALRNCRAEVAAGGRLNVRSSSFLLDSGSTLDNRGNAEIFGWEWQPVEIAGTVANRGRLRLPGHTAISGTLTNHEYLFLEDSGSTPTRVSGTLDNRGVVTVSERWDTGIRILEGGSAPDVPQNLIKP